MKIKQIFAVLAVSASLMSCNFLDEFDPNATTAGNFYTSEADIETSLNGVYQSLAQSYYYQYNYYFTDVRAHVTVVTDSGASSGIPYQRLSARHSPRVTPYLSHYLPLTRTRRSAQIGRAHV